MLIIELRAYFVLEVEVVSEIYRTKFGQKSLRCAFNDTLCQIYLLLYIMNTKKVLHLKIFNFFPNRNGQESVSYTSIDLMLCCQTKKSQLNVIKPTIKFFFLLYVKSFTQKQLLFVFIFSNILFHALIANYGLCPWFLGKKLITSGRTSALFVSELKLK